MIYIRNGVFETNSSSSHSIVMMKKDQPIKTELEGNMVDPGWYLNDDGKLHFWYRDLEFGRSPFELLTDWMGRLRYCIAYYSFYKNKIAELEKICFKRVTGFTGFEFDKCHNGNSDMGYVDHQSAGVLESALFSFDVGLEDFIFNDRYIIVIDGDEYCVFDTLMETDMFNKNAVKKIIPKKRKDNGDL